MAGLEVRGDRYNVILRFGGRRFVRSLKTSDRDEATAKKLRIEENIKLVESGRLTIPDDADPVTFLLSDGKLDRKPVARASLTLSKLFKTFFDDLPAGSLEENTIATMKIHQGHLERGFGKQLVAPTLTHDDLQKYVTKRSRHKTHKGTVGGETIKKEIVTFRTVWKWGVQSKHLRGEFPAKKLRYPVTGRLKRDHLWAPLVPFEIGGLESG